MSQYIVKSGQNIYDVALTLHGSVEGVFDLLNSNSDLSFDTELKSGDVLEYNEQFQVNKDISLWLDNNNVRVKNGNHSLKSVDVRNAIIDTLSDSDEVELPDDDVELKQYYDDVTIPEIIIQQSGVSTVLGFQLNEGNFLAISWGDDSDLEFYYHIDDALSVNHVYEDNSEHLIKLYGSGEFISLDFTNINGVYYALKSILISEPLVTSVDSEILNKLFIRKG